MQHEMKKRHGRTKKDRERERKKREIAGDKE
jgi:hypothetical protein